MYLQVDEKSIEIKKCTSFYRRLKGFMFEKKKIQYGLWFPYCRSIHTFFMYQHISVIFTDKQFKVISYYPDLEPKKIIVAPKNGYHTFELPTSFIDNIKIGCTIQIKK